MEPLSEARGSLANLPFMPQYKHNNGKNMVSLMATYCFLIVSVPLGIFPQSASLDKTLCPYWSKYYIVLKLNFFQNSVPTILKMKQLCYILSAMRKLKIINEKSYFCIFDSPYPNMGTFFIEYPYLGYWDTKIQISEDKNLEKNIFFFFKT